MPVLNIGNVGNLVRGLAGGFKSPIPKFPVIDQVTDPRTYQRLAQIAEETLGRNLPAQFRGAGFSTIPTRATDLFNKISGIPAGVGRDIQAGMAGRIVNQMAGGPAPIPRLLLRSGVPGSKTAIQAADPSLFSGTLNQAGPYDRDYGLTRELMRRAGGGSLERVAEKLVPKGAIQQGAGFLNSAFRPSSAMGNVMNAIPGISNLPGIAKNMIAPASAAGMAGYLLSLEGSTPNNYKSLGYKSEEDMKNKIRQQEAREGILASSLDDGRYIPGAQQKQFKVPALTNVLNINTSSDNNNVDNRRPENFSSPRNTEAERRAYLSELSSVAQQTAQNPLLNQYNALRKPDPRAAEDLGMQMFALANPELAKKVTPGQAGYDVIQRVYPQATTAAMLPAPVDPTGLTEEERQAIANQMFFNQY